MANRHAAKMVNPARNAHVTATAANADPVVNAVNAKSALTCAFRLRRQRSALKKLAKHPWSRHKQRRPLHPLSQLLPRPPPRNRFVPLRLS